jgi:hypothetical protein
MDGSPTEGRLSLAQAIVRYCDPALVAQRRQIELMSDARRLEYLDLYVTTLEERAAARVPKLVPSSARDQLSISRQRLIEDFKGRLARRELHLWAISAKAPPGEPPELLAPGWALDASWNLRDNSITRFLDHWREVAVTTEEPSEGDRADLALRLEAGIGTRYDLGLDEANGIALRDAVAR